MDFLPFGISLASSLLLIPWVRRLAFRLGKVALPREDRWHRKPTAMLGGIGIFIAFAFGVGVAAYFSPEVRSHWGLLLGSTILFGLGFYDDLKRLSPQAKLGGQILGASIVIFLGYSTNFFTPRIANNLVAQFPNILLTFVWLIGITNAINLLDNMDGLAGGISLITALILSLLFWDGGDRGLLAISLALAGGVFGFLIFNFPPASIFMGDSGSLFLGFTLAVLSIARQPQASNVFAVMGVPTLIFLLPILDTTLVTFTRILRGQSPAQGGRDHTSHRLIAFGLNERQTVLTLYAVALLAGLAAITLESVAYWLSLVVVPILVVSLALITGYLGGMKVVSAPEAPQRKGLTRFMIELTYRRRLLEVVLDFFLISIAYYLAFVTHFGSGMNPARLELFLRSLPLALAAGFSVFFAFGIYRGVWRYVGLGDLVRYGQVGMGAALVTGAGVYLLYSLERYSVVVFVLFGVYLFIVLAGSRSSFRILDQVSREQKQTHSVEERVLICGAGDAGEMAVRWIQMNPQLEYHPIGFIDDDLFLQGRQIHGVQVLGGVEAIEQVLNRHKVAGVILTQDLSMETETHQRIIQACRRNGCWVRYLRLAFETLEEDF